MNLIFLAAGNSTRFGSNKLLYRLNGKCMYRYGLEVVAALWQKGLLDTIVIVTQYEEIIYDIEAHFPYMKIVNNPHPEAGISGSIRGAVIRRNWPKATACGTTTQNSVTTLSKIPWTPSSGRSFWKNN